MGTKINLAKDLAWKDIKNNDPLESSDNLNKIEHFNMTVERTVAQFFEENKDKIKEEGAFNRNDQFLTWAKEKFKQAFPNKAQQIDGYTKLEDFNDIQNTGISSLGEDLEKLRNWMAFDEIAEILKETKNLKKLETLVEGGKDLQFLKDNVNKINVAQDQGNFVVEYEEKTSDNSDDNKDNTDNNQNDSEDSEVANEQLNFTEPTGIEARYEEGVSKSLLKGGKGVTLSGTDKDNYKVQYQFNKDNGSFGNWQDTVPTASEVGEYTIKRKIVKKEDGSEYKGEEYKQANKTVTSKITQFTPVVDNPDGGDVTNVTDPTTGGESNSEKTKKIVNKEYDSMSGYDNDTRTKREKRIQERAATKAERKRKKAIDKAKKKGLKVDEENHIIDNTNTPGSLSPKNKRVAKLEDKARDFENRSHTTQQEKYTEKKEAKQLFDVVLKNPEFKHSLKKIDFQSDFKLVFTDEIFNGKTDDQKLSKTDIQQNIKDHKKQIQHEHQFYKLISILNVGELKQLKGYLEDRTQRSTTVDLKKDANIEKQAIIDNVLAYLADFDYSGFNLLTIKEKILGGSVRRLGSEAELLEAFKDNCDLNDNLNEFDGTGPKTKHTIKVIVTMLLEKGTKSYKRDQIGKAFFKDNLKMDNDQIFEALLDDHDANNKYFDDDKLTLENLGQFFAENREMKGLWLEKVDQRCSTQELSDIIAGNGKLRPDIEAEMKYMSMIEQESMTRLYYDRFFSGDPKIPPYDQLGTSQYQSLKSGMYQFGQIMDSMLGYFAAIKIDDFKAKLTTNEQKVAFSQLALLQSNPDEFIKKNLRKPLFTGIWREFVDLNSSTDANNDGNKIRANVIQGALAGLGCEITGVKFQPAIALNKKKTENQDMYDARGEKTLNRSLSCGIEWNLFTALVGFPLIPKFGAGVGFENNKVKGIENNFSHAIEQVSKGVNTLMENINTTELKDSSPAKIGEQLNDNFTKMLNDQNCDPFFKNNEVTFRNFFKTQIPGALQSTWPHLKDHPDDFKKILTKSLEGCLISVKAGVVREMDRHTNITGGGFSFSTDLLKPENLLKIFTLGLNINFRSYQLRRNADAESLASMDKQLQEGTYNTEETELKAESLEQLAVEYRKAIGLQNVNVEATGNKLKITANEGSLTDTLNIRFPENEGDRKNIGAYYDGKALYIGKGAKPDIMKARLFDVQGTHLIFKGSDNEGGTNGKVLIKEQKGQSDGISDITPEKIHIHSESKVEAQIDTIKSQLTKFTDEEITEIKNAITEDPEGTVKIKLTNGDIVDMSTKKIKITRKTDGLTIESDGDNASGEVSIHVIDETDPTSETSEINEKIDCTSLNFETDEQSLGLPENIMDSREFGSAMCYALKRTMAKISQDGTNLYDIFLNHIGGSDTDELDKAKSALLQGLDKVLQNYFPGNTQRIVRSRKREAGQWQTITVERSWFSGLKDAITNVGNDILKLILERIAGILAHEEIVYMKGNKAQSLARLKFLIEGGGNYRGRGKVYTELYGPAGEQWPIGDVRDTYLKTQEYKDAIVNNEGFVRGKVANLYGGYTAGYFSGNKRDIGHNEGGQTLVPTTVGQTEVLGGENGLMPLLGRQETDAGKWLKHSMEANGLENNPDYQKAVDAIKAKLPNGVDSSKLETWLQNNNLFFDNEGNPRKLTNGTETNNTVIKLEDGTEIEIGIQVVFYLYGPCANESLGFKIEGIKVKRDKQEGKPNEMTLTERGEDKPNQFCLSVNKGSTSVTAQVSVGVVDHTIGATQKIDLTKPLKVRKDDGDNEQKKENVDKKKDDGDNEQKKENIENQVKQEIIKYTYNPESEILYNSLIIQENYDLTQYDTDTLNNLYDYLEQTQKNEQLKNTVKEVIEKRNQPIIEYNPL